MDNFVVDYTKVVDVDGRMEPDAQACFEYKQRFGKLDLRDLRRRYREAKRAAKRAQRALTASPEPRQPSSPLASAVCKGLVRRRKLVQPTLLGWCRAGLL